MVKKGNKSEEAAIFPESTTVTIGRREEAKKFEIYPLVRKRYRKMFKMLGDIISELAEQEEQGGQAVDLNNLISSIPILLQTAGDKLGEVYAFVLDVEAEWVDNQMLPNQEFALITAIFEQNDFSDIVKNFKKMMSSIKNNNQK